jgi:glycogen operon protein
MDWYNTEGLSMNEKDWNSPTARTLQYLAASTPEFEEFNRILLVVHGLEHDVTVTLPEHVGVAGYRLLWDSANDDLTGAVLDHAPGNDVLIHGASMQLFRAT